MDGANAMTPQRVRVFHAHLDPVSLHQAVERVFGMLRQGQRGWICTLNVATLIGMGDDPVLRRYVEHAALVVADGQPLVWSARLFGAALPARVAGIDLLDALCARAARDGIPVYALGAERDVLERALARLRERCPGLRIDGADGWFSDADTQARVEAVARSGARLLLVGMGSPRQEAFIQRHWDRLGALVAIGVGGSFDVIAGVRRRAHPLAQRCGMEWAVRLAQEPRRLLRRYLFTNCAFCKLVVSTLLGRLKTWATTR
jgi:N-acetylglucosaminyldiphosphoundecaprenol N-acetyl-beta-D-mannosaminyltransferase